MKSLLSFIYLTCIYANVNAQSKKSITAVYSFQVADNQGLPGLLLNDIKYYLTTDGLFSVLKSNDLPDVPESIHLKVNGPTQMVFDIRKKIVSTNKIKSYRYDKVEFKRTGKVETIGHYKCYSVASKKGDTLYLSKQIPSYVNPFLLNNESIGDGMVKAVLHNSGSFTLTKLKSTGDFVVPVFKTDDKFIQATNIFFQ